MDAGLIVTDESRADYRTAAAAGASRTDAIRREDGMALLCLLAVDTIASRT